MFIIGGEPSHRSRETKVNSAVNRKFRHERNRPRHLKGCYPFWFDLSLSREFGSKLELFVGALWWGTELIVQVVRTSSRQSRSQIHNPMFGRDNRERSSDFYNRAHRQGRTVCELISPVHYEEFNSALENDHFGDDTIRKTLSFFNSNKNVGKLVAVPLTTHNHGRSRGMCLR